MMCRIPRIFTCCAILTFPVSPILPTLLYEEEVCKFRKTARNSVLAFTVLILEGDFRVGAEFLVVAGANHQPDALWAITEIQRVIAIGGYRKPKTALHLLPKSREMRE